MPKFNAIGIDLGTSSSSVGIFKNGKFEIIKNDYGNFKTASYVAFTDEGCVIGDRAKEQISSNRYNTIFHAHRFIGTKIFDPIFQQDMDRWPFSIISDEKGNPKFLLQDKGEIKDFSPEQILALILKYLKKQAENYIGEFVKDAVISIPPCFNYLQRQAIKDAAKIAGLNILRLISSTNAGTIAYEFNKKENDGERNILIFDLGGGTLGVSILTIESGGICAVESVAGNSHFGGEDFDYQMVNYFIDEIKLKYKIDISSNDRLLCILKNACESAKCTLSNSNEATIKISQIIPSSNKNNKNSIDFCSIITREKFDELCADQFCNVMDTVKKALNDAKMGKDEIDEIILIGGASQIPKVQNLLFEFFNRKSLHTRPRPDEAVVFGAAIQAAILSGDKNINIRRLNLLDVIPSSFGIETAGGVFTRIIKRNTRLPTKISQTFTTFADNQTEMVIKVVEGENQNTKDNLIFANFKLYNIPPAPRGVPQIEIAISIDIDYLITVFIRDKLTGQKKVACITKNYLSTNVEIEKESTEKILSAKQQLLNYCFNIKRCLQDVKMDTNKIFGEDLKKIGEECDEILLWTERDQNCNEKDYMNYQKNLQIIWNPVITQLYKSVEFTESRSCKQIQ